MSAIVTPALALLVAEQKRRANPLLLFRFASEAQRRFVRYVQSGYETLFRSGNSAGKTLIGAAVSTRMLQGFKDLAGEPIPDVPTPCIGWCMVQTYKGQVDGAQAAMLQCLGDWPHKIVWVRSEAQGWIDTLYVATTKCNHPTGERCQTCSKLVFHCSESDSGVGGRVHFVWADEPPDKTTWDECRQRGTAKHLLHRFITATPKEKVWWWWMPSDFHECEDKPRDGFVEVRSSMMDNKALRPDVLKQKLAAASKDQRARAVIYGDYIDLKGECPFPPDKLEVWLRKCRKPSIEEVTVAAERRTADGDVVVPVKCKIEVFHEWDEQETYIGILDPSTFLRLDPVTGMVASDWVREGSSSKGVPDPGGLHIYSRRKPKLCMRFSGYLGAYGLGSLAAIMGRRYGNSMMDTDLTGGHGDPAVRAMTEAGYRNLNAYTSYASSPQGGIEKLGFTITGQMRAEMVSAIQQGLLDDSILVESEACVKNLMAVTYVITPSGKERPEAQYGAKDEDMICLGRYLYLTNVTPLPRPKEVKPEQVLGRLLGRPIIGRRLPVAGRKVLWGPRG